MDDRFAVICVGTDPVRIRRMEFVERKGIGHPDSLCDGVVEAVSRRLSNYYRDEFGRIPHHNTDKVHFGAGQSDRRSWADGSQSQYASMIEPFWVIPLLAIADLHARDIIGYTTVAILGGLVIICGRLTLFPVLLCTARRVRGSGPGNFSE